MQYLKPGHVMSAARHVRGNTALPHHIREHVHVLGPAPRTSLEAFVDLGLSDMEIARYFAVPQICITQLCEIWKLRL